MTSRVPNKRDPELANHFTSRNVACSRTFVFFITDNNHGEGEAKAPSVDCEGQSSSCIPELEEIAKSRETDGSASAVESAATAAVTSNTTRSSAEEELNTDNAASGKMIQKLLLQAKREEGQGKLKRLQRTLDAAHQNEGIAKVLKEKGKVSSGILASNNHFGVDNHIYDFLKARGEAEAEQERKRAANRAKAKADDEKKLKAAEEAIEQGKELTVEHAKAIAKSKKRDGDSPLAKSKEGLVAQMNRRIQREKKEQAAQQDPHVDPMEDRDEGLGDMELV